MDFIPPETFIFLGSALMPSLERGLSENVRNRRFRSFFGTMPQTLTDMWGLCYDRLNPSTVPVHFLWTFMFLKQCNTEEANSSVAGCDETTFRNLVWHMLSVISTVEIVSINNFIIGDKLIFLKIDFDNRHMRSNGNVCLVSVDGTDFCIMEPWPFSTKWWSHKFNGPGLRYEIVVCMQTGWIVMVNGPHPCGDWPDLCIARHVLHHVLDEGEHYVADSGYRSSVDCRAMTPTGRNDYYDRQVGVVRARHETVNRRFKIFGILCQRHRHPIEKHGIVLRAIANIVQLTISNGDNSFEVEHVE